MKHKNKLQMGLLFASMLMLNPCNAHEIKNATTPIQMDPLRDSVLSGAWKVSCLPSTGVEGYHYTMVYNFSPTYVIKQISFFRDAIGGATCENKSRGFTVTILSYYKMSTISDERSTDEHTNIDFKNSNVQFKPNDQFDADALNNGDFIGHNKIYYGYGLKHWQINTSKYISAIPAVIKNFKIKVEVHDIFQISDLKIKSAVEKILKFGDPTNEDADHRPISLSKNYAVKR
ncbi:MAG: hypothetical protein KAH18_02420 [Psychromonas sp.]|nr:hypothetical protein [Psychromonas sp.]